MKATSYIYDAIIDKQSSIFKYNGTLRRYKTGQCYSVAILWEIYAIQHKWHVRSLRFHFKRMLITGLGQYTLNTTTRNLKYATPENEHAKNVHDKNVHAENEQANIGSRRWRLSVIKYEVFTELWLPILRHNSKLNWRISWSNFRTITQIGGSII